MTCTSGLFATFIANSLFKVESPPLLDLHSDARKVTFNLPDDECAPLFSSNSPPLDSWEELDDFDS